MNKEREKLINGYYYIVGQIGLVQANINYARRYKYNPNAQADIIRLKDIKISLEKKKKLIKSKLSMTR